MSYLLGILILASAAHASGDASFVETIDAAQPKIVKIYGAGGYRRMEAYQSGMLISAEGHVLTVFSYVLDTDVITATLDDGRRFEARLLGADPRLEVAVLKIDATELPCFDLDRAVEVRAGTRVLAFSNLFGVATGNEPSSVQHGVISVKTQLQARRGVFETPYHGPVYVIDAATNNPGAAGGALLTWDGRLVAMLGKELRNATNNTWLNYAIPIDQLRYSVRRIQGGQSVARADQPGEEKPRDGLDPAKLGIVLVPDVLERTPAYVDYVRAGSPAAEADLRPDDLVLLVDGRLIQSCKTLREELSYIDHEDPVRLTVLRGNQMFEFELQASLNTEGKSP